MDNILENTGIPTQEIYKNNERIIEMIKENKYQINNLRLIKQKIEHNTLTITEGANIAVMKQEVYHTKVMYFIKQQQITEIKNNPLTDNKGTTKVKI